MALVIVGGGIIGLSIAYYSSLRDPARDIFIIDAEDSLLLSASGFSGGYLVRDWFSKDVLPLAELSFLLHKDLAQRNNGAEKWGYTESHALSAVVHDVNGNGPPVRGEDWLLSGTSRADVARLYAHLDGAGGSQSADGQDTSNVRPDGSPLWINDIQGATFERISSPSGCAQVEPALLCKWLIRQCAARGVRIVLGSRPTGLIRDGDQKVTGVILERSVGPQGLAAQLLCKDVVITAGCWTPTVFRTLVGRAMDVDIKPLPGYSVVVQSPRYILPPTKQAPRRGVAHSVFFPPSPYWDYSPEAMGRVGERGNPEIFIAGLNDQSIPLPQRAGQAKELMDPKKVENLKSTAVRLAGTASNGSIVDDLVIVREALCFRPVSGSGRPIISRVDDVSFKDHGGLFVASGHGAWGISLSLGTGFVVSELVQGKKPSISLSSFSLQRKTSFSARL